MTSDYLARPPLLSPEDEGLCCAPPGGASGVSPTSASRSPEEVRHRLREEGDRLIDQGLFILPVVVTEGGKKPMVKWRHGGQDYATQPATHQDVDVWTSNPSLGGWAIISSLDSQVVIIDVEPEALVDSNTRAVAEQLRDSVWPECVVVSKHDGFHAYLRIVEGDVPTDKAICRRDIGLQDKQDDSRTLIAEVRSPVSYAVVCDTKRPLPEDFAVMEINRAQYDDLIAGFQHISQEPPAKKNSAKLSKRAAGEPRGSGDGTDTGSIVSDALVQGVLPLEAVLPIGWQVGDADGAGRTQFLRTGSDSESSGNERDGVIVIHSTSVPWAEPGTGMSPMAVIAGHGFDGDFGAACRSLEAAARALVEQGEAPDGLWSGFPTEVLVAVNDSRKEHQRGPGPSEEGTDGTGRELAEGRWNNVPVGQQFAKSIRNRFLFVTGIGWHHWDGCRWARNSGTDQEVLEEATQWAKRMIQDLIGSQASNDDVRAATKYRSIQQVRSLVEVAKTVADVRAGAEDMDLHPDLLNCPNGVVNLGTGELSPSNPELLFTKVTAASYKPDAAHEDWTMALRALPEDAGSYLQIWAGQALFGESMPTDEMLFVTGGGENGKTIVLGALLAAAGDFGGVIPDKALTGSVSDHPTELMAFRGLRLAVLEELPEGKHINISRLKKIVGTPQITARYTGKDNVTFKATHTLIISSNYTPIVDEADHGTLRRFVFLPFPYRYVKHHQDIKDPDAERLGDPTLKTRLNNGKQQQEAVLAWAVAGAVRFARGGKRMPDQPRSVADAHDDWVAGVDPLGEYIEERLVFDPAAVITKASLLEDFNEYTGDTRHNWGAKKFNDAFAGHRLLRGKGVKEGRARPNQVTHRLDGGWPIQETRPRVWKGVRWRESGDGG